MLTLVTVCDNEYTLLLAALLKSIELNLTEPTSIELYIVSDGIRPNNKRKLLDSINQTLFIITWLTAEEAVPAKATLPADNTTFPRNVYIRLFIPYFVRPEINRVLYLDVDMIVLGDLAKLWAADLGDHLVAGVVDNACSFNNPWGGIRNYKELNLLPDTKLFNTGLLLLNPILWRQQNITNRVIQCTEANIEHVIFSEQYGLNVILANQWVELDSRWNCYANREEIEPYLIHFIGVKPIYKSYNHNEEYKAKFYEYLRLTRWADYRPVSGLRADLKKVYNKFKKKVINVVRGCHTVLIHPLLRLNPVLFKRDTGID